MKSKQVLDVQQMQHLQKLGMGLKKNYDVLGEMLLWCIKNKYIEIKAK